MKIEGYCMKCKGKREMVETHAITMKNGRPAIKGKCCICGANMFKIIKTPKEED